MAGCQRQESKSTTQDHKSIIYAGERRARSEKERFLSSWPPDYRTLGMRLVIPAPILKLGLNGGLFMVGSAVGCG